MPDTRWRLTDEEMKKAVKDYAAKVPPADMVVLGRGYYGLMSPVIAEVQLRKIALVLKGEAHLDIDGQGVGLAVLPQALLDSLYEEAGLVQKGRDVRT
mgnify:CR=1 FL=1